MNSLKNLKIAITPEQSLDEVVRELERLGYGRNKRQRRGRVRFVVADSDGVMTNWFRDTGCDFFKLTTLTELKEME